MDNSDDDFLDDGLDFDAIPAGTLFQLEQTAWRSTQVPPHEERSQTNSIQQNGNRLNNPSISRAPLPRRREASFHSNVEVIDLDADILEENEPTISAVNSNPRIVPRITPSQGSGQTIQGQQRTTPVVASPNAFAPEHELRAGIEEVRFLICSLEIQLGL
jgi:hypothetical protein